MVDFDSVLEKLGYGHFPIVHIVLMSVATSFIGTQMLLNAFIAAKPDFWCQVPELTNLSVADQRLLTAPPGGQSDGCEIRDLDYSSVLQMFLGNETVENVTGVRECTAWTYDHSVFGETIVNEWDLVCGKRTLVALAQSLYMVGVLFGGLVAGYLSDRFGRKLVLFSGYLGTVVFGCASAFVPDYTSHVLLRSLVGGFTIASNCCLFVLAIEITIPSKRKEVGLGSAIGFAFGYMALAGVAFLIRNFKWLNLTVSLYAGVFLVLWRAIPESPRWLLAQGRLTEMKNILTRAARMNKVDPNIVDTESVTLNSTQSKDTTSDQRKHHTSFDLLRTPNLRKRTLIICYTWSVVSLVYYGILMSVNDIIDLDPRLNLFLAGVMEISSNLAFLLLIDRVGRKPCMVVSLVIGGVACIVCGCLPPDYVITGSALSNLGKFGVSGAFSLVYVYTAELMPTVVRSQAVSIGSLAARIGALLAPFLSELALFWKPLPTILFGACALSAGLLNILLPETLHRTLPETLEDGENFAR